MFKKQIIKKMTYSKQTIRALEDIKNFETTNKITDQDLIGLNREEIYNRILQSIKDPTINQTKLANSNTLVQIDLTKGPTQNHYDYVFTKLLQYDEENGKITPGDKILETSSGSAGIAFAWACKKLGYQSVVFTHDCLPNARKELTKALATEVHLGYDKTRYMEECATEMRNYFKKNNAEFKNNTGNKLWFANHSRRFETLGCLAQIRFTLQEYIEKNNIDINIFLTAIGNGSTIVGIPGLMKACNNQNMKIIGYEPFEAAKYYKENKFLHGNFEDKFLDGNKVLKNSIVADVPGTGTLEGIEFPFNDQAVNGCLDEIIPFDKKYILEKNKSEILGKSSIIAKYLTTEILKTDSNQIGACLIYDRANRY